MRKSLIFNLLALVMLASASTAQAFVMFQAIMTHDQEVIAGGIPDEGSSGLATFFLNDAGTRLTYDVQLVGLDMSFVQANGNSTGAPSAPNTNFVTRMHIHANAAGANGGIVFGMIDASASTRNDLDALLIDGPGRLHITGDWDFNEGNGAATLLTQLSNLFSDRLYINVHTSDHAGGEIRGQILVVPEPGTLALFAIAGLGLVGPALRRRA